VQLGKNSDGSQLTAQQISRNHPESFEGYRFVIIEPYKFGNIVGCY